MYRAGTVGGWGVTTSGEFLPGGIREADNSNLTIQTERPVNMALYTKCYVDLQNGKPNTSAGSEVWTDTNKSGVRFTDPPANTRSTIVADVSSHNETGKLIIQIRGSGGYYMTVYRIWLE